MEKTLKDENSIAKFNFDQNEKTSNLDRMEWNYLTLLSFLKHPENQRPLPAAYISAKHCALPLGPSIYLLLSIWQ